MRDASTVRLALRLVAAGVGLAAGVYGACAAVAWCRYGRVTRAHGAGQDGLLDRFMPDYEIVERHHVEVAAPAAVTLAAAREQDLLGVPLIRAIFRAREIAMHGTPDRREPPRGLLAATAALGWGVLADVPDREVVVGAVTRPWEANVTFRALPPEDFAAFSEPGFVKIAWTLRADPVDDRTSIFRTETRAVATDPGARARFRRYWAFASPGIVSIRRLSLAPLARAAERRARAASTDTSQRTWSSPDSPSSSSSTD